MIYVYVWDVSYSQEYLLIYAHNTNIKLFNYMLYYHSRTEFCLQR